MKKFDERQVIVRGKIMSRALILTGILLLFALILQRCGFYDIVVNIGFEDFIISILLIIITYLCCSAILLDAFVGVNKLEIITSKSAFFIFFTLSLLDFILIIYHIYSREGISLTFILSFIEVSSISLCLLIKRKSW